MADLPQFTVVGSGLAGALLACHLGQAGYRVDLYEKRPDPRQGPQDHGRSINLALSVRGIEALKAVGLADAVLRDAIPMRGRMMHAPTGELTFQPYGKQGQAINSVSRAGLNVTLIEAAARCPGVRLFFEHRCTGVELATATLAFATPTGPAHVPADVVIGADGAYSTVRAEMQHHERFNYRQDYLNYGYKELSIPAGPGGQFRMEPNALHIWPRHSFMMIALPNRDGSFTCTVFWPYEGPGSFAALQTDEDVLNYFREQFPDAVPLMPTLLEDYRRNPVGPLVTIRCQPWHQDGRVALLGDAAHAVVPFLGQGMNAAFEDCTVLTQCLTRHAPKWTAALDEYERRRRENTDTLADLAVDNFLEMRDRVSSRLFLWRKKLGILLHTLFPRWYVPLYTLVTFTTTPYAAARSRAQLQDRVVRWALAGLLIMALLAAILYLRLAL
jgi:kynurenine 3-monooxygenase